MRNFATGVGWRRWRWAIAAGIGVALAAGPGRAAGPPAPAPVDGGMRMYRDPVTGAVGGPPAAAQRLTANAEGAAAAAARSDLQAEPVTAPAGGVKLNLRGRFQSAIRRQAGPEGSRGHRCLGPTDGAHE